jgi:hypothetical protein
MEEYIYYIIIGTLVVLVIGSFIWALSCKKCEDKKEDKTFEIDAKRTSAAIISQLQTPSAQGTSSQSLLQTQTPSGLQTITSDQSNKMNI